jgi:hypothetical protein
MEIIRKKFSRRMGGTVHFIFHSEREGFRPPSVDDKEGVTGLSSVSAEGNRGRHERCLACLRIRKYFVRFHEWFENRLEILRNK